MTMALVLVAVLVATALPAPAAMRPTSTNGSPAVLMAELAPQASPGVTELCQAVPRGDTAQVKVQCTNSNRDGDCGDFKTPLMKAARANQVEIIEALKACGVNMETKDNEGWTALMHAASTGKVEAIKALKASGANVDARGTNGETALMLAAIWNADCAEALKVLLDFGADLNATDNKRMTALIHACKRPLGDVEEATVRALKAFKDAGADFDAQDMQGHTCFGIAVSRISAYLYQATVLRAKAIFDVAKSINVKDPLLAGGIVAVSLFLDRGDLDYAAEVYSLVVDVSRRGQDGLTALFHAKTGEAVHILADRDLDVNAVNEKGVPAILALARKKLYSPIPSILCRGAALDMQTRQELLKLQGTMGRSFDNLLLKIGQEYTPLHWATFTCDTYCVAHHLSNNFSLYNTTARDGKLPVDLARDNNKRCPAIFHMLTTYQAARDQMALAQMALSQRQLLEEQVRNQKNQKESEEQAKKLVRDRCVGIVGLIFAAGSETMQILFLNLKTIREERDWLRIITLSVTIGGGCAVSAVHEADAVTFSIGLASSIVSGVLMLVGGIATAEGGLLHETITLMKQKGDAKKELIWLCIDCTLHATMGLSMLLGEALLSDPDVLVMLAGVACSCFGMFLMGNPTRHRTVAVLRGTAGIAVIAGIAKWHRHLAEETADQHNSTVTLPIAKNTPPCLIFVVTMWLLNMTIHLPHIIIKMTTSMYPSMYDKVEACLHKHDGRPATQGRFNANEFVMAQGSMAAFGILRALGLTRRDVHEDDEDGALKAVVEEIGKSNDVDAVENFYYIVNGGAKPSAVAKSLEKGEYHGGSIGPDDFDTGHVGWPLERWMEAKEAKLAQLSKVELAVARFYTSSSFWRITGPMRSLARKAEDPVAKVVEEVVQEIESTAISRADKYEEAPPQASHQQPHALAPVPVADDCTKKSGHPMPLVVYHLDSALKKMRAVMAQEDERHFAKQTVLWRGMKNMSLNLVKFMELGGTELAPMSTTTDENVARKYADSQAPLIFKYEVVGLRTGIPIKWLSLYPREEEYLYPPLTYMSYRRHYEDDGQTIIVVEPAMP